jgi:hypothetical protein
VIPVRHEFMFGEKEEFDKLVNDFVKTFKISS